MKALNVGETFAAALKKAAGVTTRKFDITRVKALYKANPDFQISDVYPRPPKA